jgi:hypothetical protein
MEFEFNLAQLVGIGMPAVKALACLEANESTAADVFIFWHAMLQAIKDVVTDTRHEFPREVQQQIFGILNSRHRQMFEDGNLSNQVHLAATYLDSGEHFFSCQSVWSQKGVAYLRSDLFKSNYDSELLSQYVGIRHVATFKAVARFLVELAEKEIKFGGKEAFTRWRGRAATFKTQFLGEFKAYARHQYPFNLPVDEKKGVLRWWQGLLGSDLILPVQCFHLDLRPP